MQFEKQNRNFVVIYINPRVKRKTSGSPTFFTFRVNNLRELNDRIDRVQKIGFKVNSVYFKAVSRKNGSSTSQRLYL